MRGGFYSWFDETSKTYPFLYSEITGYALTALCWLTKKCENSSDKEELIDSATAAAFWLSHSVRNESGAHRCLIPTDNTQVNHKQDQIYAFDNGIIFNGLLNLYSVTKNKLIEDNARAVGRWLVEKSQHRNDGSFAPMFSISQRQFIESETEWSLCRGSYHAKIAIGYINAYKLFGDEIYRKAAIDACDFALSRQRPDGRFVCFPKQDSTNAHPHCYSAEWLWVVGKTLGIKNYLEASALATKWLLDMQNEHGFVPRLYQNGKCLYQVRNDVLAQTLRLAVLHRSEGRLSEEHNARIEKLVALLLGSQSKYVDIHSRGGFYFGERSIGTRLPHINAWVTMFSIQALQLYIDSRSSTANLQPTLLV